jgi:uncharacterized protein YciI
MTIGNENMYYSIVGTDRENSLEARLKVRPEHIKRIEELRDSGRLLLAGPNPAIDSEDPGPAGFSGSLIVAEFQDLDAAREWAEQDPYAVTGVYSEVVVKPFKKVLP